jgi:putative MFS transporter
VSGHPFKTLWQGIYLKRTVMLAGLWFFALLGFFGLSSWLTTLLHAQGYSVVSSIGFVTLLFIGGIPGFLSAGYFIEKIGRKWSLALFLLGGAIMTFLYGHPVPGFLFVEGFAMQFFFGGMWSTLYAYTPELYPTRARSTGTGLAALFGRVGAIAGPIIVGFMLHGMKVVESSVFTLGAACFIAALILVSMLGPETRGKVVETISQ